MIWRGGVTVAYRAHNPEIVVRFYSAQPGKLENRLSKL